MMRKKWLKGGKKKPKFNVIVSKQGSKFRGWILLKEGRI